MLNSAFLDILFNLLALGNGNPLAHRLKCNINKSLQNVVVIFHFEKSRNEKIENFNFEAFVKAF
jgi:hypothetical protein